MTKSYKELKDQLNEVLAWFEHDDIDVDKAIKKHAEAEKLIAELQTYLVDVEKKLTKTKK